MNKNLIIFTDLDGTLLDSNYSFKRAIPALREIRKKNIPMILCSSKTRTEIEHYRKKLKNTHPFISENGGGIFVPKGYFKGQGTRSPVFLRDPFGTCGNKEGGRDKGRGKDNKDRDYQIIKLGTKYSDLRKTLEQLRLKGFDVKGFGDMSIKKVAEVTGLKLSEAKMAKEREFDEPFIFKGDEASFKKLKQYIKLKGFNFTQGDFFHIMGNTNKGRAVEILKKLYARQNHKLITAALGDSQNDIDMLRNVDYPIIVQKKDGVCDRRIRVKNLIKADGIGPEGWNRAVIKLLELRGF